MGFIVQYSGRGGSQCNKYCQSTSIQHAPFQEWTQQSLVLACRDTSYISAPFLISPTRHGQDLANKGGNLTSGHEQALFLQSQKAYGNDVTCGNLPQPLDHTNNTPRAKFEKQRTRGATRHRGGADLITQSPNRCLCRSAGEE